MCPALHPRRCVCRPRGASVTGRRSGSPLGFSRNGPRSSSILARYARFAGARIRLTQYIGPRFIPRSAFRAARGHGPAGQRVGETWAAVMSSVSCSRRTMRARCRRDFTEETGSLRIWATSSLRALDVAQDHHRPVVGREQVDGPSHEGLGLPGEQTILGGGGPVGEQERALSRPVTVLLEGRQVVLEAHLELVAFAATAQQGGVGRHPVEPGPQRGPLLERADLLEEGEEHVLHHLLGVRLASRDAERHPVDPGGVALHQHLQGAGVPAAKTGDELRFGRGRPRLALMHRSAP